MLNQLLSSSKSNEPLGSCGRISRIFISDGSIELLKWIGLFSMTIDHINKYIFNGSSEIAFDIGRLAMPIFGFVLAYNLARRRVDHDAIYKRVAVRLLIFGALALPPFVLLGGLINQVYPLNILFMLLTATAVCYLIEQGYKLGALAVFLIGGALVEFWWPAVGFCVAIWLYLRHDSLLSLLLAVCCCACLYFINNNAWALAALPLFALATYFDFSLHRLRWFFYAFYPLHLFILFLVRIPLRNLGFLFF